MLSTRSCSQDLRHPEKKPAWVASMGNSSNFGLPMLRPLLLLLGVFLGVLSQAQPARIVFNSTGTTVNTHPFVVFNPDNNPATNPGTYLVIDNSNANAITLGGTATVDVPIIKSETEFNKIRWATGAATGIYLIPFSTTSGISMPLTVNKTTAGVGGGSLIFSTYNTMGKPSGTATVATGWNNVNYMPTDVTHMNDEPSGLLNNSNNAIDRFWIIDAGEAPYAYSTKPVVNLTFGFDPLEAALNGGNTPALSSGVLVAQRFNTGLNKWHDIVPMGAQAGITVAGAATPTAGDFFRSWTLSNSLMPLPITLVDWEGQCEGKQVVLKWTTASEQDNHYFTIEKSRDASEWSAIGTVPGAGNSSSMINYSFIDDGAQGLGYYRLRQTDINGTTTVSNTIAAGCGTDNGTAIVNAWDDGTYLNLVVSSTLDAVYDLTLMDAQGKVMTTRASQVINTGSTTLRVDKRDIATGIYMVQLYNSTNVMSRRVHLD